MGTPTPTPEKIGRYEILGVLGKGAMGLVYKARDPNIGRLVALKTARLDAHAIEADEMLVRFKNEARAAGVLTHSNIVTVYDVGEHQGLFYIAMEYIEGVTLQRKLNQQPILPIEQVLDISRQVCAGLDYAHAHDIVHRDIKPANIMMEADGRVKIMDFGIAKAGDSSVTTVGQVVGTPNYMSPEQVKGRPLDGRSDLWSVGVMLYEMLTGERPFTGQNVTTIIYKIVNEEPIAPKELDPNLHPALSAVIMRALAKNPDKRYQQGADLVHHLVNYKSIGTDTAALAVDAGAHQAHPGSGASAQAPARKMASPTAKPAFPPPTAVRAPSAPALPSAAKPDLAGSQGAPAAAESHKSSVAHTLGQKLDRVMEQFKRITDHYSVNQWLLIGAGVLAIMLVIVSIGVYWERPSARLPRPTKAEPAENVAAAATQARPVPEPTAQPQPTAPPGDTPAEAAPQVDSGKTAVPRTEAALPTNPAASAAGLTALPATSGTLRLVSQPAGAKVQIDGWSDAAWVTPFTSPNLSTGKHKIVFTKPGYAPDTRIVEVTTGTEVAINATLYPGAAPSHLNVVSDPAGAAILVDGQDAGRQTPATLDLGKGQHRVVLRKLGYRDEVVTITLAEGETFHLKQALRVEAGPSTPFGKIFGAKPPEGMGALQVKTRPRGATVTINGETAPRTTPLKIPLDPGTYTVVVSMNGFQSHTQSMTVDKGKTTSLEVELKQ